MNIITIICVSKITQLDVNGDKMKLNPFLVKRMTNCTKTEILMTYGSWLLFPFLGMINNSGIQSKQTVEMYQAKSEETKFRYRKGDQKW